MPQCCRSRNYLGAQPSSTRSVQYSGWMTLVRAYRPPIRLTSSEPDIGPWVAFHRAIAQPPPCQPWWHFTKRSCRGLACQIRQPRPSIFGRTYVILEVHHTCRIYVSSMHFSMRHSQRARDSGHQLMLVINASCVVIRVN